MKKALYWSNSKRWYGKQGSRVMNKYLFFSFYKRVRLITPACLAFWVAVFLWTPSAAQLSFADSLKSAISATSDSPQKVELLCNLAYYLVDIDDDGATHYAEQAKEIATKLKYQSGLKDALTILGLSKLNFGKYYESLALLRESRNIPGGQRIEMQAYNLMLMGSVHQDWANFDSAIYYYQSAIKTIGEKGDAYFLSSFYRGLASVKIALWQNQQALDWLKKAEEYARQKPRDYNVLMNIWRLYGKVYQQLLDKEKSKAYYAKMCNQEAINPDLQMRVSCKLADADQAIQNGNYQTALAIALQALEISDIHRYPGQRLGAYKKIGSIYTELSQYMLASKYFLAGLKIADDLGLKQEAAQLNDDLAWMAKEELDLDVANVYAARSIAIYTEINDRHGLSVAQNTLGLIYFLEHKYNESLSVFEKSLKVRHEMGNAVNVSASLYNMSLVYEAIGKYDKAYQLRKESVAMDEKLDNPLDMGVSYNGMAMLLIKLKKNQDAEKYLSKAMSLSLHTGSKMMRRNVYLNYARLYEATNNYKQAGFFYNRYIELNDSLLSQSNAGKLAELQALYQVERKETELKQVNLQKKTQEEELKSQVMLARQQWWIIAVSLTAILLLLVAVTIGYKYLRNKNKSHRILEKLNREILEQKEEIMAQTEELMEASETISGINKELENKIEARTAELKQAYKELDTFFYRASHDFRRPITTFLGLAGVAKITIKDLAALELFEKVSETAKSLDKMLYKLQSISDVGSQQMVYKEVLLKELLNDVLTGFKDTIQEKKIAVTVSVQEQVPLVSYPAMIKIIIENLIENAFSFSTTDNPTLSIKFTVCSEHATLTFEDNGQGIMEEYKARIFEMYFRANENSKGNGLGLYITQKAVEKLNGHIHFKSEYAKGSTFTVDLSNQK